MGQKMLRCNMCGMYTLKTTCDQCGLKTSRPQPAIFSPGDPYGKYRRLARKEGTLCRK